MTWIQYWIPFVGFRSLPEEVIEELELDPYAKCSGFMLSWLGYTLILWAVEKYE